MDPATLETCLMTQITFMGERLMRLRVLHGGRDLRQSWQYRKGHRDCA